MFVKNIFYTKTDNSTLFKVWVTLYTCAGTRGILLDIVPYIDAPSFIRCFRRFVSRRGCPSYMISDGGKNFVSRETQTFVNSLGVDWEGRDCKAYLRGTANNTTQSGTDSQ